MRCSYADLTDHLCKEAHPTLILPPSRHAVCAAAYAHSTPDDLIQVRTQLLLRAPTTSGTAEICYLMRA